MRKGQIETYGFGDNFLKKLAAFFKDDLEKTRDLSGFAVVFGGRRPALFLKRELSVMIKEGFIAPEFFSIDEFVRYIVAKKDVFHPLSRLEACFEIYSIAKKKKSLFLKGRKSFAVFLPWAEEIVSFIDRIDLEDISEQRLINVEKNADIGYEVPQAFNELLKEIVQIRSLYHQKMESQKRYSRGYVYLKAARICDQVGSGGFKKILFCNFFHLHQTEKKIFKYYLEQENAKMFFHKDKSKWPELEMLEDYFGCEISADDGLPAENKPNIYAGFDVHSQVGIVREILQKTDPRDFNDTVIVLPKADALLPLLSEISLLCENYNVSMGYPVNRTSIYDLINLIIQAQKTRRNDSYYTKDYLSLLKHPLIKNLEICDLRLTRIIVHKIEEILIGIEKNELAGSLFADLSAIENSAVLADAVINEAANLLKSLDRDKVRSSLRFIHEQFFLAWSEITDLAGLAAKIDSLLEILIEKSMLKNFPLNMKIADKIFELADQFRSSLVAREKMDKQEIFKIFADFLKKEKIAFSGAPLKGLQILGLFETRALTFKNVIIMDVNESVLPKLSESEPLVPRGLLTSLGIDRLESEESIQRYQFMRLIKSAQNVHLIYNDNPDQQRSRFIEEIIWQNEKTSRQINSFAIPRASFRCEVLNRKGVIEKNEKMIGLLSTLAFSASSLNVYLKCPMRFYFKYILGLAEKDNLLGEIESREIGNFLHEFLEQEFLKLLNKEFFITEKFQNSFFDNFEKKFNREFSHRIKSDGFMIKQIMRHRLKSFLENEKLRGVQQIIALEMDLNKNLGFKQRKMDFKCRIDRVDRIGPERLLIIDYKTGSSDSVPAGAQALEKAMDDPQRKTIKRVLRSVQLPVYLLCAKQEFVSSEISCALYNLRNLKIDEFPKTKELHLSERILGCVTAMIGHLFDELFDINIPFEADESEDSCMYCDFINLCK